ncbi:MAG: transposase [Acidobacteriota bacterium]|nr:transposase [Acidobacteriota bacterium]
MPRPSGNRSCESSVIAMDETPIRAGRKGRGRMKTGYFWPIYGDRQMVIFPFMPTPLHGVVHKLLGSYAGRAADGRLSGVTSRPADGSR